jgi:hypothetical protein
MKVSFYMIMNGIINLQSIEQRTSWSRVIRKKLIVMKFLNLNIHQVGLFWVVVLCSLVEVY